MSTSSANYDRLQGLTFELMVSAWEGLDNFDRSTVVDLLSTGDFQRSCTC